MRANGGSRGMRALTSAGLGLSVALLAACGGEDPTSPGGNGDGTASVASVEVTPAADTLTAVGSTLELTAVALDASGNELAGVGFRWSSSDEAVVTVDGSGVAEAVAEGEAEVVAMADGVSGSAALAVDQEVATVAVRPSSATLTAVGDTQTFTAAARDANGHEVAGVEFGWTSSDSTVATVDGDGLATARGNGTVEITATAGAVPGQADLAVSQAIAGLEFGAQPTDAVAGEPFDPVVRVEVVDAFGNRVEETDLDVTLSVSNFPFVSLSGSTTVGAEAGVAVFDDVWLEPARSGYVLEATVDGSVDGATSQSFDVTPGPVRIVSITSELPDVTAGEVIQPPVTVTLRDEFGNLATHATETVTVAIANNPPRGTLSGTVKVDADSGRATFDDLSIETAGEGYRLQGIYSGINGTPSFEFDVAAAEPAGISFLTQPSDIQGQEVIEPAIQVEVLDEFGNRVEGSDARVTVNLESDPTGGRAWLLRKGSRITTTSKNDVDGDGVVSFEHLSIDLPGAGYTLRAGTTGLPIIYSDEFSVHLTFTSVSAGFRHSCGVTTADRAYCWGLNGRGQLGDGTTTDRLMPVAVHTDLLFAEIDAGSQYTCAVTAAGDGYCWGANSSSFDDGGRLGDGTTVDRHTPVAVSGGHQFATISAGGGHTCGVTTDAAAFCWGHNLGGALGDGTEVDRTTPVAVSSTEPFADVSAGTGHTCAVTTTDKAYCWGFNSHGQVGDGTTEERHTPVLVSTSLRFSIISAGGRHSCAVTGEGRAYCWGLNNEGQLGSGGTHHVPEPVDVSAFPGFTFAGVSAGSGGFHSCGMEGGGSALCWGYNADGRLGDGTTSTRFTPVVVSGDLPFTGVSAGSEHTCGVTDSGGLYCWGRNDHGQLGDDTTTGRLTPVQVVQ